jgi:hypothetical protein
MLRLRNGLRTDGRIDWEVLGVQVNRGEVTLYGEDQNNDQKGLDQSGDGAELAPPQNFYRAGALHMPPLKAKQVHLQLKAIPIGRSALKHFFEPLSLRGS